MNEQIIILIFLVLALGATLWLYILKAKKQVEYKGDERWLTIQLKANQSANIANWTLIILLAIATSVPLFIDIQIMFTLDRVDVWKDGLLVRLLLAVLLVRWLEVPLLAREPKEKIRLLKKIGAIPLPAWDSVQAQRWVLS